MRYQVDSIEETDKNLKIHYFHTLELGNIGIGIALRPKKQSRSNFAKLDSITMTTHWDSLIGIASAVSEIEIEQNGLMHVRNYEIYRCDLLRFWRRPISEVLGPITSTLCQIVVLFYTTTW